METLTLTFESNIVFSRTINFINALTPTPTTTVTPTPTVSLTPTQSPSPLVRSAHITDTKSYYTNDGWTAFEISGFVDNGTSQDSIFIAPFNSSTFCDANGNFTIVIKLPPNQSESIFLFFESTEFYSATLYAWPTPTPPPTALPYWICSDEMVRINVNTSSINDNTLAITGCVLNDLDFGHMYVSRGNYRTQPIAPAGIIQNGTFEIHLDSLTITSGETLYVWGEGQKITYTSNNILQVNYHFEADGITVLLEESPTPAPTPTHVAIRNIYGIASLQGRAGNSGIDISINGTSISTVNRSDGSYTIDGVTDGSYTIEFRKPGFLKKNIFGVVVSGSDLTLSENPVLIGGDIDCDNYISFADFSAFVGALDAVSTNENYIEYADIDGDDYVSFTDFGMLVGNLDKVGD